MFLTAFVFSALVSFSHGARAEVLIDCSGKEGYQLQICEQQKALAEKNAKSNERAQEEAREKIEKASEKATEATNAQKEADNKRQEEYSKYNEASKQAEDAESRKKAAEAAQKAAQQQMTDAISRGDTAAAQAARDEMVKQQQAAKQASEELDKANEAKDEAYKTASKAQKEADKAAEKAQKAAEKAEKEKVKAAEKAEKNANKDLKKAQKEYDKLQEECAEKPEKCNVEELQAAKTNLDAAKANASAATKNREDVDGTTAAKEQAAAEQAAAEKAAEEAAFNDYIEEQEAYEPEIKCTGEGEDMNCVEVICDENGENCSEAPVGTYAEQVKNQASGDQLDENGNPVSQQRCYEARDNIFKYIACKAMTTLADVRVIVYTIAGFGLIAFAFAAIFNKISWKHLANLCIALFILSMMTPFINYFTHENGSKGITYGNYLPAGFTNIDGSDIDAAENCDTSKGDVCPDVNVDTSAKDSKWSWSDLKNTVKNGINAAKTAYDTYKTVKNTVETTVEQAKKIGTAIKNSEGGLTGVLDTLGEVATASNTIFNTVQTGASAVVSNASSIATDVQNAGKSGAELAFDQENQTRINELEKKLAAGNLTPQEQEWAKAELEQRKAAVDSNKVTDFANNQGQKALDKINQVVKTGNTVTNITTTASNAAQQGATIGGGIGTATGDTLGAIFGLATAAGEGIGAIDDAKQAKIDAANAEKAAAEKAAAEAKRKEEIRQNNASYSQGKQWDNSFNASMESKKTTSTGGAVDTGTATGNQPATNTATQQKTPSGQQNYRTDEAPNGTVTTPTMSYYSPEQEAFDNDAGRNKNSTKTQSGSSSVTRTYTTTTGGSTPGSEGVGGLPQSTTTTQVTIQNAEQKEDGTVVVQDDNGTYGTYDEKGKLLSTINYVTGEQKDYQNKNNPTWGGQTPSWGQF